MLPKYYPAVLEARLSNDSPRARSDENGRKFSRLVGSHYRQYRGTTFYMDKGKPVEFNVDGRVMIDAEFFQKINPNYSRRKITESADMIVRFELWDAVLYEDDDESGGEASGPAAPRNVETTCPTMLGSRRLGHQHTRTAENVPAATRGGIKTVLNEHKILAKVP